MFLIVFATCLAFTACSCDSGDQRDLTIDEINQYINTFEIEKSQKYSMPGYEEFSYNGESDCSMKITNFSESYVSFYLIKTGTSTYEESKTRPSGAIYSRSTTIENIGQPNEIQYYSYQVVTAGTSLNNGQTYYYNKHNNGYEEKLDDFAPNSEYFTLSGEVYTSHTVPSDNLYYDKVAENYYVSHIGEFVKGTEYYKLVNGSYVAEVVIENVTCYNAIYEYDEFIYKNFQPNIDIFLTKSGDKYYYCERYYENINSSNGDEIDYYGVEAIEISKQEKDREIEYYNTCYLKNMIVNITKENLVNKDKIIALYGESAYNYSISGTLIYSAKIIVNTVEIGDYTFMQVPYNINGNQDTTIPNVLFDVVVELSFNENGNFYNLVYKKELKDQFKIYSGEYSTTSMISNQNETFKNISINNSIIKSNLNEQNEVTINFVANESITPKVVTALQDISLSSLPTPATNSNYTFNGWYYDRDYKFPVESSFKLGKIDASVNLYAKYTPVSNPTINLNGGILTESTANAILLKDYIDIKPVKAGYKFEGWYTTESFETSSKVSNLNNEPVTSQTTLYAKYTKLIVVTLNTGLAKSAGVIMGMEGNICKLPLTLSKTGCVFDGWYTSSDFQAGTKVAVSTNASETKYNINYTIPSGDITLYAKFAQAITVTFHRTDSFTQQDSTYSVQIANSGDFDSLINLIYNSNDTRIANNDINNISTNGKYYMFAGLYTDYLLTTPLTEYPTGDIDLYSKFIENWKMEIEFNVDLSVSPGYISSYFSVTNDGVLQSFNTGFYKEFYNDLDQMYSAITTAVENLLNQTTYNGANYQIYMQDRTTQFLDSTNGFKWSNVASNTTTKLYVVVNKSTGS